MFLFLRCLILWAVLLHLWFGSPLVAASPKANGSNGPIELSPDQMQALRNCGVVEKGGQVYEFKSSGNRGLSAVDRWNLSNLKISGGSGKSSGEGALIVFAVIGVVVVIAVVPYALYWLYDSIKGGKTCYFSELGLAWVSTQANKTLEDNSSLRSYNQMVSLGLGIHIDKNGSANIGLKMEAGYLRVSGRHKDQLNNFDHQGAFLMVGPKFYFARSLYSGSHGYFELIGGKSLNTKIGTVGKAQAGFHVFPGPMGGAGFGLAVGSLLTNATPRAGFRDFAEQFDSFLSLSFLLKL